MERYHRAGRNELACNSWANLLAAEDKLEMFYVAREAVVKYMGMTMENMADLATTDRQINETATTATTAATVVAAGVGGVGGGSGSGGLIVGGVVGAG
ncbi:hypothetical protein Ahia01_000779300, partial [Argonauta hians]